MPADRLFHPKLGHSAKVAGLSHLEFRVWHTYELAADDYGIMRFSAVTIQAANDALEAESKETIQAALEQLAASGLVHVFEHQERRYCCQLTWQNEQRVKHPRDTSNPPPPQDLFDQATQATQKLWTQHNSLRVENVSSAVVHPSSGDEEPDGKSSSDDRPPDGSLARAHGRETANGYRLMANGLEGVQGETPPMDIWAREFVNLYPPAGRCGWNMVEGPLYLALTANVDVSPQAAWDALRAHLEQHKRSYQWRVKRMIPRADKWLREGMYLQVLEESAPVIDQLSSKTARTLQAAANILKEGA